MLLIELNLCYCMLKHRTCHNICVFVKIMRCRWIVFNECVEEQVSDKRCYVIDAARHCDFCRQLWVRHTENNREKWSAPMQIWQKVTASMQFWQVCHRLLLQQIGKYVFVIQKIKPRVAWFVCCLLVSKWLSQWWIAAASHANVNRWRSWPMKFERRCRLTTRTEVPCDPMHGPC